MFACKTKLKRQQVQSYGEKRFTFIYYNVPFTFLQNVKNEKQLNDNEMKRHIREIVEDAVANNKLEKQETTMRNKSNHMVIDLPTFCRRPTSKFKYLSGNPKKFPAKKKIKFTAVRN
jgi:hypothetical protein